jgi:hypothetical protein
MAHAAGNVHGKMGQSVLRRVPAGNAWRVRRSVGSAPEMVSSMTGWLLIHVPTALLAAMMISLPTLLAVAVVLWVRRRVPTDVLAANNEQGGILFGSVGTIYAIFLAFMVVVVWQQYGDADKVVTEESAALVSLHRDAGGLSEPTRSQLRGELRAYAEAVRDEEWDAMARGESSPRAQEILDSAWQTLTEADPRTAGEAAVYGEALARLDDIVKQRQLRLLASEAYIPAIFWAILLGGGLVTIGFACFFGMPNARTQAVMTGLMTAMIASALFLVVLLDGPFTGDLRVSSDAFNHALDLMDRAGR